MSLGNLSQNYFSRLLDPKYRQAQQQQNLFSNLLQYGAQMRAAGAPTTNVGQPALLASRALGTLGQNLMKGNQAYQKQLMDAIKLKSMMDTNQLARQKTNLELKNLQATLNARNQFQNMFSNMAPKTTTVPQTIINKDTDSGIMDTYSGGGVSGETQVTSTVDDVKVGKFGFVMTPDRINTLRLINDPDKASELFTEFRKRDDELIKDARNRLKPTLNSLNETIVKINKVNEAVKLNNGTADLAAINSYQRLIDEGVVRGEDVALQARASDLYGRLKLLADNVRKGDLLTPELRKRMAETSNILGRAVYDNAKTRIGYQRMLAQKNNVPWQRVYAGDELYEKYLTPAPKLTLDDFNLPGLPKKGN